MYKETKSGLSSLIYTGEQRVWPTLFVSLDLPVYYREANSVTYSSTCLYIYREQKSVVTLFRPLYIYRGHNNAYTL